MNCDAQGRARIAAFFDLDGTLVALPSLERRFFRMLRYRRAITAKNYWLWLAEALRLAPRGVNSILHGNKMYLRGVAVERLGKGGLRPAPPFMEDGLERVAWHARLGHTIVIVSGTVQPLAMEIGRVIEMELAALGLAVPVRVCATRLEENAGRWTGRIVGDAMFGLSKVQAAQRIAEDMQLDLADCYAYGDSVNDRWLLEAVGHAAAVNPSIGLAQIAREQRWPVLRWKAEKNLAQRTQRGKDDARNLEAQASREIREASARSLG